MITVTNKITLSHDYNLHRAVANGPVGPAMAGPIIEPANFLNLKKKN